MQKTTKIYSVSQVNLLIKVALEEKLPSRLIVKGEISDWKHHSSGHCYFSLKDESGILPCVMWASKFKNVKFSPEDGLAVLVTGYIDVYPPHGKYQFYVESMAPAGVGALQLAFEQMVKKLRNEGLFDDEHKKVLPPYPMRIGILTSESGAALHDIADSIYSLWPCAKLFLYPVPVQGDAAANKIAAALYDINNRNKQLKLDVLIVGRGGGSLEDLWAFNEEVLARAVFKSKIPIISAVGHEVDTTISDLVADARASTPTKAGAVAVPDMHNVLSNMEENERSLNKNIMLCLAYHQQQLDESTGDMIDSIGTFLSEKRENLYHIYEQIVKIEPHRLLGYKRDELNKYENLANTRINSIINNCRMTLTAAANRIAGLNPKSVLNRGYSITSSKKTGLLLKNSEDIQVGDFLITELKGENLIESKVTKK